MRARWYRVMGGSVGRRVAMLDALEMCLGFSLGWLMVLMVLMGNVGQVGQIWLGELFACIEEYGRH
jgi:hypothetical protein